MQIQREGTIRWGDASLSIWEEGLPAGAAGDIWKKRFKAEVFARVVQTLNRLGWTVTLDPEMEASYTLIAKDYRACHKGALQGRLHVSGRCIELEMFQNVNAPDRPDHGGRFQRDKEQHMPYLLRLEMERTRRRISTYLCNVFAGYQLQGKTPTVGPHAGGITALEAVRESQRTSGHYRPELGRATYTNDAQQSGDGQVIEDGMRVYAQDYRGRIVTGTALYCLNGNWMIVTGRYGALYNVHHNQVYVSSPGDLRVKRNQRQRRARLEREMAKAVDAMDFERAAQLRDVLFPKNEPLYLIYSKKEDLFFRANYSGYTGERNHAGKYTREELRPYMKGELETEKYRAVAVS